MKINIAVKDSSPNSLEEILSNGLAGSKFEIKEILNETDRKKKSVMVQYLAQQFRIIVLEILHDKGTGHWGGASSAAEILTTLYFDTLNIDPENPVWEDRDRLVLSKGHASCMYYTVLAHRGFFPIPGAGFIPAAEQQTAGASFYAFHTGCRYVYRCSRTWDICGSWYGAGIKVTK